MTLVLPVSQERTKNPVKNHKSTGMSKLLPRSILAVVFFAILVFGKSPIAGQENLRTFTYDGQQLQVHPADHGTRVPWGPPNDASGATNANSGSVNTQTITVKYGNWYQGNYAAGVCADLKAFGYSDWYLPSRGELQLLYRSRNEIGGFSNGLYWSSTDDTWGAEAFAVDFNGGVALSRYKNETNRIRCVRKLDEIPRYSTIHPGEAQEHGDYIPMARYRINDTGAAGLVFASKMLGFFSAAAFNETFLSMAGEILKSEIKSLGIKYVISGLNRSGSSTELPSFITICFPLKDLGRPLELSDILFLEEFSSSRLVPLGFPGTLYYRIKEKSVDGPILASSTSVFIKSALDTDEYDYLSVYEASRGNHTIASANKTFQTVGVVAKYKKYLGEIMMILKQFEHYSSGFASGTDMTYISIKIPQGVSNLPLPGSVVHVFGETKNLNEIGRDWRLQVSHTPLERKATAKYFELHSMDLISGGHYSIDEIIFDKSIFSLHFDASVYQGVLIDFSSIPDKQRFYIEKDLIRLPHEFINIIRKKHNFPCGGFMPDLGHQIKSTNDTTLDLYMAWFVGCPDTRGRGEMFVFDNAIGQLVGRRFGYEVTGPPAYGIEFLEDPVSNYPIIRFDLRATSRDLVLSPIASSRPVVREPRESGTFTDPRDGQAYKWVRIGDQIWMAENLNYAINPGSWCYDDQSVNCDKYGRLYDFRRAILACPAGWHLPSIEEWRRLIHIVGVDLSNKIKSQSFWPKDDIITDEFNFTAIPGGMRTIRRRYYGEGIYAGWWTASHDNIQSGYFFFLEENAETMQIEKAWWGEVAFSIRCVRDAD